MSRKIEILDALIEIFRTQGVSSDFTIKELADKVNIGKSTIYEYFSTKDEILQEAIIRVINKSIEEIESPLLVHETFETQMKSEFIRLFNLAQNSRFLVGLITPGKKPLDDASGECMREKMKSIQKFYQDRFQEIFTKGIEEGLLQPHSVAENVLVIYSLVTGSIMTLANSNLAISENVNVEEYIDKIYNVVLKICN